MKDLVKAKKTGEGLVVNGNVFLSNEQMEQIKQAQKQINICGTKIEELIRNATENHFITGQILAQACLNFPDKRDVRFASQVARITGLPEYRVKLAKKIYLGFKDNPEALKHLSVKEAVALISPNESKTPERQEIEYAGDEEEETFDWEEFFKQKPVSKVNLNQYRITAPNDSELWIVKRGVNVPMKIMDVFAGATDNPAVVLAHKKMMQSLQAAAEEFYAVYEQQEEPM